MLPRVYPREATLVSNADLFPGQSKRATLEISWSCSTSQSFVVPYSIPFSAWTWDDLCLGIFQIFMWSWNGLSSTLLDLVLCSTFCVDALHIWSACLSIYNHSILPSSGQIPNVGCPLGISFVVSGGGRQIFGISGCRLFQCRFCRQDLCDRLMPSDLLRGRDLETKFRCVAGGAAGDIQKICLVSTEIL